MSQTLALNYTPRSYFRDFHERNNRFSLVVAHRRSGKTYALCSDMVVRALNTKQSNAQYCYISPLLSQSISIAWKIFKTILGPILPYCKVSETRHSITLPNTAEIRLFGLDNEDSLRGYYMNGCILDEAADIDIATLTTVILPALSDRRGWLVFAGTPKGVSNAFFAYREKARTNPKWYYKELPASATGILSEKDLLELKEQMSEEDYAQEMECSWISNNRGSIYGKYINEIEETNIYDYEHIKAAPVNLVYDLGFSDKTAVWFYQIVNGNADIIDYYETSGQDISSIIEDLYEIADEKGYRIDSHWLPHDALDKNLITGKSIIEVFWAKGLTAKKIPELSVKQGINIGRRMMKLFRFHKTNTYQGVAALKAYKYKWNPKLLCFSKEPLHDFASHAADSYRYLSIVVSEDEIAQSITKPLPPSEVSGIPMTMQNAMSLDYVMDEIIMLGLGGETYQDGWL